MVDSTPALGFVSKPIPGGGSYTLTSLLGEFLKRAEEMAGPRDASWTVLGIEYFGHEKDGAVPHIWFPGDRGQIAIRLTEDVRCDIPRAAFQLAHEAAHLISPNGGKGALNIEEGFATILAEEMSQKHFGGHFAFSPNYQVAYDDTKALLAHAPDAIAKARKIEPRLWVLTPAILGQAVPGIDTGLAERLCQVWLRNS
jgi:hypothetical protein